MGIKVRAIARGIYGPPREVGDEFEIKDESGFSKYWMEKLTPEVADKPPAKPPAPPENVVLPPPMLGPTTDGTAPKPSSKPKPKPGKPGFDVK